MTDAQGEEPIDLSNPRDARKYIGMVTVRGKPIHFVTIAGRDLWVKDMTDEEAVCVAYQLYDMVMLAEFEGKPL